MLLRLKSIFIFLVFIGLTIFGILIHPSMNGKHKLISYLHHLVYDNKVHIECADGILEEHVVVIFEYLDNKPSYNPDGSRNRAVAPTFIQDTIYVRGEEINKIPYSYGKQTLWLYYKGEQKAGLYHWQTNSWHVHNYYFELSIQGDSVYVDGRIEGPDAINGEKSRLPDSGLIMY